MSRAPGQFVCQSCGAVHPKWTGRCDACGAWNTLLEEPSIDRPKGLAGRRGGKRLKTVALGAEAPPVVRQTTGIGEFDRVTGGGLVPGSAVLIGGDPGIGKSTLLLQVAAAVSGGAKALYVSGEEAVDQIRLRASRLGLREAAVDLAIATSVDDIESTVAAPGGPDLVVIDSIQTLHAAAVGSAPGTVTQVRAAAQVLIGLAKTRGFTLILVGHVTKDGSIAGPRVLEHMVDSVLYFEGDRGHQFRILRAVKNRFGATDEIGVFEMTGAGLAEVPDPSSLFLSERDADVAGCTVFAGLEGSRPMLVEIQALIAPCQYGTPRRAVVGWDASRLAMILAVLEARAGTGVGAADVFLNIAGGLKISEPAADLAVAAAIVSALNGRPVSSDTVVFGEIGLAGEVRPVSRAEARLKEAARLGFGNALIPGKRRTAADGGLTVTAIDHISELSDCLAAIPRSNTNARSPIRV